MRKSLSAAAGAMLVLLLPCHARAQSATQVVLDNDSFNFWQPPNRRADREYTQGTRVSVLLPTSGGLVARLLRGPNLCHPHAAARDCRMLSFSVTQGIYTPTLNVQRRLPGERPYAGWLGGEVGAIRERRNGMTAFALELGVTGDASLAAPAQKAIHRLLGFPEPQGWDAQLPSEVAFLASWRGAAELLHLEAPRSGFRLRAAPLWSVRAGTVATDATVGVQLTLGVNAPPAWQGATNLNGDRWGLFVRTGAQQTVVGRNLFLDGSTFGSSASVRKLRSVAETQAGLGARTPIGMLEWQVHSRAREYQMQPRAHAYSTLSFSLR